MYKARLAALLAIVPIVSLAALTLFAQGPIPANVTPAMGGIARFASGASGAPSISFTANPFDGFFWVSTGHVDYTSNGNNSIDLGPSITLTSTGTYGWALSNNPAAGIDTAIGRAAAGILLMPSVAFAALGTPAAGAFVYCTDCTIANPCAGAGAGAFAKRMQAGPVWVCN